MFPIGSKRPLDQPSEPPNKRLKGHPLPARSFSPFQVIPHEVIAYIFKGLHVNNLLNFETVCFNHAGLTPVAWYRLREKHHFHLDWKICQSSHKLNYRLSKAIVNWIRDLPAVEGESTAIFNLLLQGSNDVEEEEIELPTKGFSFLYYKTNERKKNNTIPEKLRNMRETFPPFEAFIQLTQLPDNQIDIPEKLSEELEKEDSLLCLAQIYLFAKRFWHLKKQVVQSPLNDHTISETTPQQFNAVLEILTDFNHFNTETKEDIKELIWKGAIYLHHLTTTIFRKYLLITNSDFEEKDDNFRGTLLSPLIELAYEAVKRGDDLGFSEFWFNDLMNDELEIYAPAHLLEDEGFKTQILIQKFMNCSALAKNDPNIEIKKKDNHFKISFSYSSFHELDILPDHAESIKQLLNTKNLPLPVLYSLFAIHFMSGKWKEADLCLTQILTKDEPPPNTLLAAATLQMELKNLKKANEFYEKYLAEIEIFSQEQEPYYLKYILLEALDIKIELEDFKEANRYINKLFRERQEEPIFISKELVQKCLLVKKAVGDRVGTKWFESLDCLIDADIKDPQACQKADQLLQFDLSQSKNYLIPAPLLFKAGDIKLAREKWFEANWFYDQHLRHYKSFTSEMSLEQILSIALAKYRASHIEKTSQLQAAINWYTFALNRFSLQVPDRVYINLVGCYMQLQQWKEAKRICQLAIDRYGTQTPQIITDQLSSLSTYLKT